MRPTFGCEPPVPPVHEALPERARTGLARVALGSGAAAIVRSSPAPVLVVPPERA